MGAVRDLAQAIGKANIVAKKNKDYGVARGSRQKPVIENQSEVNRIRLSADKLQQDKIRYNRWA
jgi:hypothetical protein